MRAWELYEQGNDDPRVADDRRTGGTRNPIVSLRHINRLKRLRALRKAECEQRQRLCSLMYADPNTEQRSLDQREAELRLRELQAHIEQAIAKAEVSTERRNHLHQLAMREVNRRIKKT